MDTSALTLRSSGRFADVDLAHAAWAALGDPPCRSVACGLKGPRLCKSTRIRLCLELIRSRGGELPPLDS
eukprot:scaffold2544_cov401-Prasinococcus_capsulatus_cf.AAC.16